MLQAINMNPQLGMIIGDLVAKNSDWPGAEEIAKRLKAMLPPEIANLEKVEGLPEEAQAIVARAQGQLEQMNQTLAEGTMILQAKDAEIADLKRQMGYKDRELDIKEQDMHMKHNADVFDTKMEGFIAMMEQREGERMEVLTRVLDEIQGQIQGFRELQFPLQ